jgi:hypothetical protein
MESSHFEQLVTHLQNQNLTVRAEALNIALQLTGTDENRKALRKAGLTKQLLRNINDQVYTFLFLYLSSLLPKKQSLAF